MRKLTVFSFLTLDGVIQEPDKPDTTGRFPYGGWTVPFLDDSLDLTMPEQLSPPFDLVLGRKTYEIFAGYWPYQNNEENPVAASFNTAKKYVASHTLQKLDWQNSMLLQGDVAHELKVVKQQDGPALQVHGSANLVQTLLKHDLVDELLLMTLPITLGAGQRLFAEGTIAAAFTLREVKTSLRGVIVAFYERAGEVQTGSIS
ncbi:MAG TPA: dihydrofolate reductase family protein [Ktedonobacterales bacterium]